MANNKSRSDDVIHVLVRWTEPDQTGPEHESVGPSIAQPLFWLARSVDWNGEHDSRWNAVGYHNTCKTVTWDYKAYWIRHGTRVRAVTALLFSHLSLVHDILSKEFQIMKMVSVGEEDMTHSGGRASQVFATDVGQIILGRPFISHRHHEFRRFITYRIHQGSTR